MKLEIAITNSPEVGGKLGHVYVNEAGQVRVSDISGDVLLGQHDPYELLDAAPCDERYGMVTPGPDCKITFFALRGRTYLNSHNPKKLL